MNLKKTITSLLMCPFLLGLGACSSDDIDPNVKPDNQTSHLIYNIAVVYSTGGLGDMGFSDEIYDGICQLEMERGDSIQLSQYFPEDREDALWYIDLFLDPENQESDSNVRNLLILADGTYGDLLTASKYWKNNQQWDVLLLDAPTQLPQELQQSSKVYAPTFSYYGAAYQAALIAYQHYKELCDIYGDDVEDSDTPFQPAVVMANDQDEPILNTLQGLRDGFAANSRALADSCITYLANKAGEGYNLPDSAFSATYKLWKQGATTMYPLCGGSAIGMYRFSRMEHAQMEGGGYLFDYCGIDADRTYSSNQCTISLKKNISSYLQNFHNLWMNTPSALTHHEIFGLDSEYIELISRYKLDMMEQLKEKAIEAEKKYLKK